MEDRGESNLKPAATKETKTEPGTWLNETFQTGLKNAQQLVKQEGQRLLKSLDVVLPLLETIQFPGGLKKTYDIAVDLDDEVARKFSDPAVPADVQENYKKMRTAEMEHQDVSTVLDNQQRAELAAWMLFPENDDNCKEGRKSTVELTKSTLDRQGKQPTDVELKESNRLKARVASYLINEHDYLKKPEEVDHPEGVRHLPADFIGPGGKKYDVRKLYEDHMFAVLEGTKKSPLKPDERAVVAFHLQTLGRVLPGSLLNDDQKPQRDGLLAEYTRLYADRNYSLAAVPDSKWQQFRAVAAVQLPSTARTKPSLVLSDAEKLKEELNLADVRQILVEQAEMKYVHETNPNNLRDKPRELAYPDDTRLKAYRKFHDPLREYDVMRRLQEQLEITGVQNALAEKYIDINNVDKNNNIDKKVVDKREFLKRCEAYGDVWQRVYWASDLSKRKNQTNEEAWHRFPVTYCAESDAGRKFLSDLIGPAGLNGDDEVRLTELKNQLPCSHDLISRLKGK